MLIGVAGMVGTGKTTLTLALAERFGLRAAVESVDQENPWLGLYYEEPDGRRRYGFELQLHFLTSRMRHLRAMRREGGVWVVDRTFYEDAEVFARRLYEHGEMTELRWRLYHDLYEELCHLPAAQPPRLLIYLHAPLPVVVERIRARGRGSERNVPESYWAELQGRYEQWIDGFDLCPVLKLDVRSYDLLHDPRALEDITAAACAQTGLDLQTFGTNAASV